MPLYEVVLRYENRDEIRLTDHDPRRSGQVQLNGRTWQVVASADGQPPLAGRVVLEPVPSDALEVPRSA